MAHRRSRRIWFAALAIIVAAACFILYAAVRTAMTRDYGPLAVQHSSPLQQLLGDDDIGLEPGIVTITDECVLYHPNGDAADALTIVWNDWEVSWEASSRTITTGPLAWLGIGTTIHDGQTITGGGDPVSGDWVNPPADRCPKTYVSAEDVELVP